MKTIFIISLLSFLSLDALTLSASLVQLATMALIVTAVFIHQSKEVKQ
jgi:hypothetical protein